MSKTKIAYVTGTRAEYGIVCPLLKAFNSQAQYSLDLYATGMHLMPEYGSTVELVANDFPELKVLEARYSPDKSSSTATFIAELYPKLVDALIYNRPDAVLVHGDRAEMLVVATVCLYLHIPILHTQGGDISATDDNTARQVISKLAQMHFPATEQAKKNLMAIGVPDRNIHVVGTLSLDTIAKVSLLSKVEALSQVQLPNLSEYMIVTQHPVSEQVEASSSQMKAVLDAVSSFDLPVIIIYPNADPGSKAMIDIIKQYRTRPNWSVFKNIPYEHFISLIAHSSVWVGNSSAGIVDSPYLKVPVVNVGIRQQGRELSANILSVPVQKNAITSAIKTALSDKVFLDRVKSTRNHWGSGIAVSKILSILKQTHFPDQFVYKDTYETK